MSRPVDPAGRPGRMDALLREVPFFGGLDRVDAARLVGALEPVPAPAGTVVVAEGAPADGLYLLETGTARVTVEADGELRELATLEGPAHFGELGLLLERRTSTVTAATDLALWRLSRDRFERVVRERPELGLSIARSTAELMQARERDVQQPPARPAAAGAPTAPASGWRRRRAPAGLALLIPVAVPLALWLLPSPPGLGTRGWHLCLILLGAGLGWLLAPVPEFVVALLLAAAWGAAGLAPTPLILAGFASPSWLVGIGAFALAVSLARSGLLFRAALALLRLFPATHSGQVVALLVSGVLLTPMVPFGLARVAAVAPLARELADALGHPPRSRGSAAIALAALIGHGLLSSIFLSGLVMNFFVLDLLPAGERAQFGWTGWLAGAAPAGLALLAGSMLILLVAWRPRRRGGPPAGRLAEQVAALGPMASRERVTLLATGVFLAGLVLQPVLRIDTAWLAVGGLAIVLGGGTLERARFQSGVDWGFLLLFGVMLGAGGVLHAAGVDTWITGALVEPARGLRAPGLVLLLAGLLVLACRLVLPSIPATLLLSLALVPAASRLGIDPWVMGFVVLTSSATWSLPAQSDFVRVFDAGAGESLFSPRQGLLMGLTTSGLYVAAILVSIPYWRLLGWIQ